MLEGLSVYPGSSPSLHLPHTLSSVPWPFVTPSDAAKAAALGILDVQISLEGLPAGDVVLLPMPTPPFTGPPISLPTIPSAG